MNCVKSFKKCLLTYKILQRFRMRSTKEKTIQLVDQLKGACIFKHFMDIRGRDVIASQRFFPFECKSNETHNIFQVLRIF